MAVRQRKGGRGAEQNRALRLLAGSPVGYTEAIMLAHGFTVETLGRLVLDGHATATPGIMHAAADHGDLADDHRPRAAGAPQPTFIEVWDQFLPFWKDADYFLAHNAPFDRNVLTACCSLPDEDRRGRRLYAPTNGEQRPRGHSGDFPLEHFSRGAGSAGPIMRACRDEPTLIEIRWPMLLRRLGRQVGAARPYPMIDGYAGTAPDRHDQQDGD
jgi:hypothetical protein